MARALAGILAALDARDVRRLERSIVNPPQADFSSPDHTDIGWLHICHGDDVRTFAIRDIGDERHLHVQSDDDLDFEFGINRRTFQQMIATAPIYRGSLDPLPFDLPAGPSQRSAVLLPPYEPSPVTFDQATMKLRLYHGMNVVNPDADRDLTQATIRVREPKDYDPRNPAGLLVWASPTPSGEIPHTITQAADAMGFVCVGVDDAGQRAVESEQVPVDLRCAAQHAAAVSY